MVSDNFWQQSQLILALELFGIIVLVGLITLGVNVAWKRLRARGFNLDKSLESPTAARIFASLSILIALAGMVTLFVTVTPGVTPFADRVDQNLELGGLLLFILWPIIAAQVALGFFGAKEGLLSKEPVFIWMLLIFGYIIFLSVDRMAISLVYE